MPPLAFELLRDLERDDAADDDEAPSRPRDELAGSDDDDDDDDDAPKVMARMTAAAMMFLLLSKGPCAALRCELDSSGGVAVEVLIDGVVRHQGPAYARGRG